jgi:heptosyltransferase III
MRRNVLIIHQAALGDFIVTWPLAMALGRTFPQSRIIYVTSSQKGRLAQQVMGVEATDAELGWHALYADPITVDEHVARLLAGAHSIISFVSTPGDRWEMNVRRLAGEAQLIHLATVPGPGDEHVTQALVRQLRPWTAVCEAMGQMLRYVKGRGLGRRTAAEAVVIHPGSGKAQKCWPVERFTELARRLAAKGKVRVLLGEVEAAKWPRAWGKALAAVAEVRRPQTLLDLHREIAAARVFVGNDSGPGHLAAILGVPTVSLHGGAVAARWRPLGPRVRMAQANSLEELAVEQVEAAVDAISE